jgi:hypothetical protein
LLHTFSEKILEDGSVQPSTWPDSVWLNMMGMQPPSLAFLCAVVPDRVTQALLEAAKGALQGQEPAPPAAERQRRLRAIEREVADIRSQHKLLVDQANNHGVVMAHLPEEQARRLQVSAKHEAWERDALLNRRFYERHPEKRPPEPPTA